MAVEWTVDVLVQLGQGPAVLATDDGAVPRIAMTLAHDDEWTVARIARRVGDALGFDRPILEVHFDTTDWDERDGPRECLAVTEPPPASWRPPRGYRWRDAGQAVDAAALVAHLPSVLRARAGEYLAESAGRAPTPALRPRWSRTGWHDRTAAWLTSRLDAIGRPPTGPIEQISPWPLSAILRAATAAGDVWLKAVFPSFWSEVALTALLAAEVPGRVPRVLAADPGDGLILLDDFGKTTVESIGGEAFVDGAIALIAIQRHFESRTTMLRAAGVPHRPLERLPGDLRTALAHPVARAEADPDTAGRLVSLADRAVAAVIALEVPDTLVHGDFHAENVVLVDGRPVVFDWSDAAIGQPLLDLATWFDRIGDADLRERTWAAVAQAWADVCPVDRSQAARRDILAVGAAYQVISYVGILAALEPARRPDMAHGLTDYLARMETTVFD